MKDGLAVIGGLLAGLAVVPYLIDILKKKTKPNIVSWLTWTILTGIASAAAFAAHEPKTAILTVGSSICTAVVVVLGLKYGIAKMNLFDAVCQIGAVLGLVLWLVFNSPSIAIFFAIIIDFVVALPTFKHSWVSPQQETWQTFMIGTIATFFTLASLSHYTFSSLAFPLYLTFANLGLALVVVCRRIQKGLPLAR